VVTATDGEGALRTAYARLPISYYLDGLLPRLGAEVLHPHQLVSDNLCVCGSRCRASERVALKVSREG
jgi:hypothetical protein